MVSEHARISSFAKKMIKKTQRPHESFANAADRVVIKAFDMDILYPEEPKKKEKRNDFRFI